mmetsp:Transcript_5593/g.18948  ORF Transcript_5593/g.18948 Transcript_5593/m.18948 type:complete len:137 (+) Transcript_5593:188-598(+)
METGNLHQAKLVLLGDMGAGKSSLVLRFVKGQFFDYQESTIGAAFLTKTIPDLNVKFEIWCARRALPLYPVEPAKPRSAPRSAHRGEGSRSPAGAGTRRGRSAITPWRPCTTGGRRPRWSCTTSPAPIRTSAQRAG